MGPNESNELTREHQGGHHVQLSSTFWCAPLTYILCHRRITHVYRMDPQQLRCYTEFSMRDSVGDAQEKERESYRWY